MADLERTVAIIFEGVDQMGAGIDSATRQIDKFGQKAAEIASPLASVTKGLLAAEAAAVTVAIAFGSRAYDAAKKFEGAQADLAKVLGDSDGSVEQFTRQITSLSNAYGESSTDLLQAMANFKQAGFTAEESLQLVKNGLDLVIAGDLEAAQASEVLVATLKGFDAPAREAAHLLEVLNASSNTYATDVDQLSQGMARLSPIAGAMGLSFEETAELLIPVIEVFRSGPEAANALRTGLLRLGDDSKPVQEALESLGVSQRDVNGVLRDSDDILRDVAAATSGMAESEKLFVAQQLFGLDQSAKMITVLGSLEDSSIDVNKAMAESASVAEEVAIRLGTAEKAGDRVSESFENLARTLGTQFLDEMTGINNAIAEVFVQFEQAAADGALDDFFDAITPTLDNIKRLAAEVAQALPEALEGADYSGFVQGMAALFGNLEDASISVEDLQGVIEGLGGTFKSLSEFTAGTIEVFKGLAGALAPLFEAFLDLDGDTQKLIGTIGGISLVVGPAVGILGGLTAAVRALAGRGGIIAIALPVIRNLSTALGRSGGLGFAAIAATTALAKLYDETKKFNEFRFTFSDELKAELDKTAGAQKLTTEFSLFQVQKIAEAYGSLSDYFGFGEEAAEDFKLINDEAINAAIAVSNLGGDAQTAGGSISGMGDAAGEAAEKTDTIGQAAIDSAIAVGNLGDPEPLKQLSITAVDAALAVAKIGEAGESINVLSADINDTSKFVRGLDGNLIDVNKSISTMGEVTKDAGDEAEKGLSKFDELGLALEELASNERIKKMEFTASINTAALQADANKVDSILNATSQTISNLGESTSSMFGTLSGDGLSGMQEWDLEDAIEQQVDIQREAADQQKELIDEQIKSIRAKTQALQNGDGLIKIDSTGLEPALEKIMWEIIEKVQLRANAEGSEFLLGI